MEVEITDRVNLFKLYKISNSIKAYSLEKKKSIGLVMGISSIQGSKFDKVVSLLILFIY